ncbi:hypothetical protein [Streptomyces sp. NPDC101181]|uniref:hypothetical protein n=1 Tax=Streptomyces sp. NPDC101181 TaxID=3366125 RepID=UPI00381F0054
MELYYRAAAMSPLTAVNRADAPRFGGYGPVAAASSSGDPVPLGGSAEGRVLLRTAEGTAVRSRGPVALDGTALHLGGPHARPTAVGLGPDAAPWVRRPWSIV